MANPTTNFGWQMPTATDLVTDLPADFEVFGQAVDTALVDLKGGTTGQVLAKASNTNMDFSWVTTDDANAIQNSIVDAKGDLVAASANDTPARLAVGNNGETIVADSSTSTGLRYQNSKTVNYLLNSNTSIWQRGTSIASAASVVYGADRFAFMRAALATGATMSRQAAALTGFEYSMRLQRDTGNTNTEQIIAFQALETSQSIPLAGKTVTFSFYAKAGANFSATTSTISATLTTGTGTDQSPNAWRFGGWTSQTTVLNASTGITTTWTRYQATATLGSSITQVGLNIGFVPTGTAGANDWVEVTGLQLEIGSIASIYQTATGTIQGELAACQRYYWRSTANGFNNQVYGGGFAASTTTVVAPYSLPVQMRTNPTVIGYANIYATDEINNFTPSAVVANSRTSVNILQIQATVTGATAYRPYLIVGNGTAGGYIDASAEL